MIRKRLASAFHRILRREAREATQPPFILDLRTTRCLRNIGNKAQGLRFLMEEGFPVPTTYVCTSDAYLLYLEGQQDLIAGLRSELREILDPRATYAVRSSSNFEDDLSRSFAGQFKSVLNVQAVDPVLQAIWSVWATARSPAVQTYLERNDLDASDLMMAVVIQRLVDPVISGVAFSRNPVTGLDETVVEAVEGSGEALVQAGVTPRRWVYKWGDWIARPGGDESDEGVIRDVVEQTQVIARAHGSPVDLEWVYDGDTVYWLQMREITSLDIDIYSNRISREVFPGVITPLVWSVNVPLVNGAWVRLLTELIGPNEIDPESLAKAFSHRAYFNMGTLGQVFEMLGLPRESLELLMGLDIGGPDRPSFKPTRQTYGLLPRLIPFGVRMLAFGRRVRQFLPSMEARYKALPVDQLGGLTETELMEEIEHLYQLTQEAAYYNIVTPLLMQAYNGLLKSQLDRLGFSFESLDLTGDLPDLEEYDPNPHLAKLNSLYRQLDAEKRERIRKGGYGVLGLPGTERLKRATEAFIQRFGHLSDSGNDFSSVPWREQPDLILRMIVDYAPPGDGAAARIGLEDVTIPLGRRPLIRWLYRRAQRFIVYREAVGSLYTYGYGLFRIYFLALGGRLMERGILASRDDVFYLSFDELKGFAAGDEMTDCRALIADRKREIEEAHDASLPSIIYGDHLPSDTDRPHDALRGTPTSRGQYTGPLRIVRGIRDFHKLQPGDVLVIPYSDVGWTPLFAKAGAVIAESGGLLSHSSIIAREYGIPAVVSVPGASKLRDGTLATVDGYRGVIALQEVKGGPPEVDDEESPAEEMV